MTTGGGKDSRGKIVTGKKKATWNMTLPIEFQTTMDTLVEQHSTTVPSGYGQNSSGRWQLGLFVFYVQEYTFFFEDKKGLSLNYLFTDPYGPCVIHPPFLRKVAYFFPCKSFHRVFSPTRIFSMTGSGRYHW